VFFVPLIQEVLYQGLNMSTDKKDRTSFCLSFSSNTRKRMDKLCKKSGVSSYEEVLRDSLSTYELLINHKRDGFKIFVRDENGVEKEVILNFAPK
jgi:hypothetical protein